MLRIKFLLFIVKLLGIKITAKVTNFHEIYRLIYKYGVSQYTDDEAIICHEDKKILEIYKKINYKFILNKKQRGEE